MALTVRLNATGANVETGEQALSRRIIGRFLRQERVRAGLTQWEVAQILGYSSSQFVSNWERGISRPPLPALPKIAQILHVMPKDLIKVMHRYQTELVELQMEEVVSVFSPGRKVKRGRPPKRAV
jgi:transcriptional regulator with XRE-family HTH domain